MNKQDCKELKKKLLEEITLTTYGLNLIAPIDFNEETIEIKKDLILNILKDCKNEGMKRMAIILIILNFEDIIIRLAKLLEKDISNNNSENDSVERYIKGCDNSDYLNKLKKYQKEFRNNIKSIRNKYIAHLDKEKDKDINDLIEFYNNDEIIKLLWEINIFLYKLLNENKITSKDIFLFSEPSVKAFWEVIEKGCK